MTVKTKQDGRLTVPLPMSRQEHIQWCKARAIEEMNYNEPSSGLISMASDLRKHPETNSETLISLTMSQLMINPKITRQEVINFINGFN